MTVYQMLLAEPFRLTKAEIGELTDWDIWELYLKPATEKARDDADREEDESPSGRGKSRLPNRDEYIATGASLGGNVEDLGRAYDRWAASEEGQRLTRVSDT